MIIVIILVKTILKRGTQKVQEKKRKRGHSQEKTTKTATQEFFIFYTYFVTHERSKLFLKHRDFNL